MSPLVRTQPRAAAGGFSGAAAVSLALLAACSSGGGEGAASTPPTSTQPPTNGLTGSVTGMPGTQQASFPWPADFKLGDPISGLTAQELAAFERGRVVFNRRFKPSEGLGPFYNATSCASCHSTPVVGGSSQLYRNFYIAVWGTDTSQSAIPPFLSPIIPAYGTGFSHGSAQFSLQGGRTRIPATYAGFPVRAAQRNAISVFGTGLFEFISNSTIVSNADPEDLDGDGISGRFNTENGAIGRFGNKAQSNNIESFTRAPLQNQMAVTTNPFLGSGGIVSMAAALQGTGGADDPTVDADGVPDPELSHDDLGDLIAFTRFLAPPRPRPFLQPERNGKAVFDSIGCTGCHIPSLPSSRGPVNAYTDLLIHDMGSALADGINFGIPQASASSPPVAGGEFRTQPLWGVSMHGPFLHDGRAETLDEAITLHGGEATASRDAYLNLSSSDRADLIAFLEAL